MVYITSKLPSSKDRIDSWDVEEEDAQASLQNDSSEHMRIHR